MVLKLENPHIHLNTTSHIINNDLIKVLHICDSILEIFINIIIMEFRNYQII